MSRDDRRFLVPIALFVAVALPPAALARCRTVPRSPLNCTDGNPTCDLDGRRDGVCVIALCDTGSSDEPRLSFCAGTLRWKWLYDGRTDRSFVVRTGRCPSSKRRVHCRPVPEGTTGSGRGTERTCTVTVDAPRVKTGPAVTRCRIDAVRAESASGQVAYQLHVRFPDAPFTADGVRGELTMNVAPLHEGVFMSGDPEQPAGVVVGNLGGESIPIRVQRVRLQIDAMSRESTIWTDDIHGTLDVEQDGGPFDPRRVDLHLEF